MLRSGHSHSNRSNSFTPKLSEVWLAKKLHHKKSDDLSPEELASNIYNKISNLSSNENCQIFLLVCGICLFIGVTYLLLFIFSTKFLLPQTNETNESFINHPSNEQSLNSIETNEYSEMDKILLQLIEYKKNNQVIELEKLLTPTMNKYCLNSLNMKQFKIESVESFHMNLENLISFLAHGSNFETYDSLKIIKNGGIIDPNHSKETPELLKDAQSCPLLDALYNFGKKHHLKNNKNSEIVTSPKLDEFDAKFAWKNVNEFVDIMILIMTTECSAIGKQLSIEDQKSFILNFYDFCEEVVKTNIKGTKKKYMVGQDAFIYEVENYNDKTYIYCEPIEYVLNHDFQIDKQFSFLNVKIAVDEKLRSKQ